MWVDSEAEVRARMRDRAREAERQRLVARARASQAGSWGRLREAAAYGLMRTGLRLLDAGRA
jgi:hypothetical protein